MEEKYAAAIRNRFRALTLPPINSLDIPDEFQFMDEELIELIQSGSNIISHCEAHVGINNLAGPVNKRIWAGKSLRFGQNLHTGVYTMPMNQPSRPDMLNLETLAEGVTFLSAADPALARIHANLGLPPLWAREPGFPTLVHIILEQQVSLASAKAAFVKLQQTAGAVTPETFLKYNDDELKRFGFSRQKSAYCRGLAHSILRSEIDLEGLALMDDASARSALIKVKGIGPWTADIYLLMVLLRPDSWPSGDLALAVAAQELKGMPSRPGPEELERIASLWRPWRAVAARLLWHSYLSKRSHRV